MREGGYIERHTKRERNKLAGPKDVGWIVVCLNVCRLVVLLFGLRRRRQVFGAAANDCLGLG